MNPHHALEAAVSELQRIIDLAPLTDDQRSSSTPCSGFTVAQLAEHIIDTHNLLLGGAGGQPISGSGSFSDRHADVTAAAIAQWANRGTDGTIDLGGNEVPAAFGLSLHTLETYIHGWDLAQSLGRPFEPPDDLTSQMWSFANEFITDDLRGDDDAPYAAAVDQPSDPTDLQRIIAHSGRDPYWRAV